MRSVPSHAEAEPAPHDGGGQLCGRERQLDEIHASLNDPGGPRVIVVRGERGSGRSTLLRVAADGLRAAGTVVVELPCLPGDGERSFLLVLRLVTALAQHRSGTPGHRPPGTSPAELLAAVERDDRAVAAVALAAALAQPARLAVVVDDAQHADPESLRLLGTIARAGTAPHVRMLASLASPVSLAEPAAGTGPRQPYPRTAAAACLAGHRASRSLVLAPLERRDVADFLTHRLRATPDDALTEAAHHLSRGVPAALGALVTAWRRRDAIRVVDSYALLTAPASAPPVPADDDRFLVALRALGEPAVTVASALSVLWPLGRSFEPLAAAATGLPAEAVRAGLGALVQAGIAEELPGSGPGGPRGWTFRVPLTEHAVRERLGPLQRGRLAAAAVHALCAAREDGVAPTGAGTLPDPTGAGTGPGLPPAPILDEADADAYLADRITEAGPSVDRARAVAELSAAAERSRPDVEQRGMLRWLRTALRLVEDPAERERIRLRYAEFAYAAGDCSAAREAAGRLISTAAGTGTFTEAALQEVAGVLVEATAAGGHRPELARMATAGWWDSSSLPAAARVSGRALALCALGRWREALTLLAQTERVWNAQPSTRVLPTLYQGAAELALGRPERFRRSLVMPELHLLPPDARYTVTVFQTDHLLGLTDLRGAAELLTARGLAPEHLPARSHFLWRCLEGRWDDALALSRRLMADGPPGMPAPRPHLLHEWTADLQIARGGIRTALRLTATLRASLGDSAEEVLCRAEARALRALGDPNGAEAALRRGLAAAKAGGEVHATDELWAALADVSMDAGDFRRAADCLEHLKRIETRTESERTRLLRLLVSARLLRQHGADADADAGADLDVDTAHRHLRDAVALARRRGQPFETAVVLLAAARQEGNPAPALHEAYELFGTTGAALWRFRARTAMRDAGLSVPARSRATAENDRLLAHLITDGLTNRQMSAVLGISEDAVANRLTRLFARFGVRSRTEVVSMSARARFPCRVASDALYEAKQP